MAYGTLAYKNQRLADAIIELQKLERKNISASKPIKERTDAAKARSKLLAKEKRDKLKAEHLEHVNNIIRHRKEDAPTIEWEQKLPHFLSAENITVNAVRIS